MIKRVTLALAFLIVASGCGGGGGAESAATPAPPPAAPATPPAADSDDSDDGAGAIAVPSGFDFATSKPLTVRVDLAGRIPDRAYLTICKTTTATAAPDYSACLLRTPVIGGRYTGELQLPNDIPELAATVWSFSPADVVEQATWTRPAVASMSLDLE